ncbi:MAG: hypothetical protein GKR93_04450 [Gammaproteobacteria bacterium]|nr:hypothetical protein [Gammaproteobacteria bacterium]
MDSMWVSSGFSPGGFEWEGGETINFATGSLHEAVIGPPNYKSVWWLEKAIEASRRVCRIKMVNGSATGFVISDDILITNNHVFGDEGDARSAQLQFDYRMLSDGNAAIVDEWECDPDDMFKTNPALDYSIVRVKKKNGNNIGDVRGSFNLRHGHSVSRNQRVNIIQHPQGRFQEIAFRDNQVKLIAPDYVQYLTDTDYGSSGSPALDDFFNVVALHNQRVPDPSNLQRWYRNQGYRIEAILQDAGSLIP